MKKSQIRLKTQILKHLKELRYLNFKIQLFEMLKYLTSFDTKILNSNSVCIIE
jgi:hypothetical protein